MATPLRDLTPRYDVKGGSPRTPSSPIPVREYQEYVANGNGNGVWKSIACGCAGLIVGLLLAWFTAIQGKGVTQKEMQEYIIAYYATEKRVIAEHTSQQDGYIGILQGKQDKMFDQIVTFQANQKEHDRDITEIREKLKLAANYLEEQQKVKK